MRFHVKMSFKKLTCTPRWQGRCRNIFTAPYAGNMYSRVSVVMMIMMMMVSHFVIGFHSHRWGSRRGRGVIIKIGTPYVIVRHRRTHDGFFGYFRRFTVNVVSLVSWHLGRSTCHWHWWQWTVDYGTLFRSNDGIFHGSKSIDEMTVQWKKVWRS